MRVYRRRLPHVYETDNPVFLTWRLHGSLPSGRYFGGGLTSGEASVAMDRLLDEARTGPFHLRIPEIAGMVVEAFRYNAGVVGHYALHAFVVMPNHVHLLVTPKVPLPLLTKSLKNFTSLWANRFLGRTGAPFWQGESYDRVVRDAREFERIRFYIENNPVRAGIVADAAEFRWSSAWDDRRSSAGRRPAPQ